MVNEREEELDRALKDILLMSKSNSVLMQKLLNDLQEGLVSPEVVRARLQMRLPVIRRRCQKTLELIDPNEEITT